MHSYYINQILNNMTYNGRDCVYSVSRLIVEECANGSDNLEDVFEGHLKRIGRMVAILDTWDQPVYLSRVWTVYEQYVASTIGVQVRSRGARVDPDAVA